MELSMYKKWRYAIKGYDYEIIKLITEHPAPFPQTKGAGDDFMVGDWS